MTPMMKYSNRSWCADRNSFLRNFLNPFAVRVTKLRFFRVSDILETSLPGDPGCNSSSSLICPNPSSIP